MSPINHYPLGQEFCARCGTRLMIVVAPSSARFDPTEPTGPNEEHLLERISALENALLRVSERLGRALDLILQQAQNSHFDRALMKALVDCLSEDGLIDSDRLQSSWIKHSQKDAEDQLESERRDEIRNRIVSSYHGDEREAFEKSVNDAFDRMDENESSGGFRLLQRAAEMSTDNVPLMFFLGEHFFRTEKTSAAQRYLSKAHELSPKDQRVSLLLGLTYAENGDSERAKELLNNAKQLGGSSFAAHYGLGRLFLAESKWRRALQEFKLALASKVSPEAHYALGCLYYQLSRDVLATRHLKKALELDENYEEALYVLGLIAERAGDVERARSYFRQASKPSPSAKRRTNRNAHEPTRTSTNSAQNLLTVSKRRLAQALRQDALKVCSSAFQAR
jgi:Flp pilus assembly protein TadD